MSRTETGPEKTKLWLMLHDKGGVGKTLISENLAATIAYVLDPKMSRPVPVTGLAAADSTENAGMTVAAARREGLPLRFAFYPVHNDPSQIVEIKASGRHKYLLVDAGGGLDANEGVKAALAVADRLLIPVTPDARALDPTIKTVEDVAKPSGLPYTVILNNWDPRDGEATLDDLAGWVDTQGWPRTELAVRHYRSHSSAPALGVNVPDYKGARIRRDGLLDFSALANYLLANPDNSPHPNSPHYASYRAGD